MKYEIKLTKTFKKWLDGVKNPVYIQRIIKRFDHIQLGNLGDYKQLANNLYELRFGFGGGI